LLATSVETSHFNFSNAHSRSRHVLQDEHGPVFVVANIWMNGQGRSEKESVLIVLDGNSNERRHVSVCSYSHVVCVTWSGDHTHFANWLPDYLHKVHEAICHYAKRPNVPVDVLGLSRGHCASMNCCEKKNGKEDIVDPVLEKTALKFRHFFAAGGCIWLDGHDSDSRKKRLGIKDRVRAGIAEMNIARMSRPIFRFIVLSRMDASTRSHGDTNLVRDWLPGGSKKEWMQRLVYESHAVEVEEFGAEVRLLNLANHSETLKFGVQWSDAICDEWNKAPADDLHYPPRFPSVHPDIKPTPLVRALASYAGATNAEVAFRTSAAVSSARNNFKGDLFCFNKHRHYVPPVIKSPLGDAILRACKDCSIITIGGDPGTGKSTRAPVALLRSLLQVEPKKQHGIVVLMNLKEAQHGVLQHIKKEDPDMAPFVTIWNGDTKEWPEFDCLIVLVTPACYFWRKYKTGSSDDVQHIMFEIHDGSDMTLFALSQNLHELQQNPKSSLKVYLVSATQNTTVFTAIRDVCASSPATARIGAVEVQFPEGVTPPGQLMQQLSPGQLPANFGCTTWVRQVCGCIVAIATDAFQRSLPSATLVIVPGEAEVTKIATQWGTFTKNRGPKYDPAFRFTGQTPYAERSALRVKLESLNLDGKRKNHDNRHIIVVATAGVAAKAITIPLNGLVSYNLTISIDRKGFLRLAVCGEAEQKQRKGRGGRTHMTLFKIIEPSNVPAEPATTTDFEMPKRSAMMVLFAAVLLGESFPIIGISDEKRRLYYKELQRLALIHETATGVFRLTPFGCKVSQVSLDVPVGLLAATCSR
jgi:hypothetical protein